MAYPGTIGGAAAAFLPEDPGCLQRNGPFEYGSNLYVCLADKTTSTMNNLNMHKSTDGGNTWSVVDSSGGPLIRGVSDPGDPNIFIGAIVDVLQVGAILYVAYLPRTQPASIVLNRQAGITSFDCSTDTWQGALTTTGPDLESGTVASASQQLISLQLRSNGDFVLVFQGGSGMGSCSYAIFSGGTWGAEVVVAAVGGSVRSPCGACIDSTDRIYFFYPDTPGGLFQLQAKVLQRSLSSANVLADESVALDDVQGSQTLPGLPLVWNDGGNEKVGMMYSRGIFYPVPYFHVTKTITGQTYFATALAGAMPSFSSVQVNFQNPSKSSGGTEGSDLVFALDGSGNPAALWISGFRPYSIECNRRSGGNWQTVNTVGWDSLWADNTLYGQVTNLQGRYLSSRSKFGFIYQLAMQSGTSPLIVYNEV